MPRTKTALTLVGLMALAGCSMAPDYARPPVETGAAYKELGPWQQAGTDVPPTGKWWEMFGDQILNGLEEKIEAGNPSLAAATARYAQASALVDRNGAALLPEIDMGAQVGRSRVSAGRPLTAGAAVTYNNVAVGPSLSYELDLFGRVRNSVLASETSAQAAQSDLAAVRLGLQAQLASAYFDLRGLDARTVLLRETVEAYQRAYDLTDTRHSGGIASSVDISRAQTQLSTAKAELDAVIGQRARDEHAIAVLLGDVPSRFALAVSDAQPSPPRIPVGIPSTLLERRPDVAAAERRVAAANAQIGVARAAMYPKITLGVAGGFQSIHGNLLDSSNGFWSLGPLAATFPLFDGGANRANVDVTQAQYDLTVADYRQTVLTAFREVEDDLATTRHYADQERNQRDAAAAAERTRDLALTRYRDGAANYLEVVTAQTAALDAERALLDLHSQQLKIATDTVRALGGGYHADPEADRTPAPSRAQRSALP
ncbi:efflux transporter outer membrane subunit [Telmatospirillum siberiense]|uniref:RND transporter n=1 Tax=Telmatospirillum siberiense TaxID=382514 RepID=A0A2N3PWN0_9PROT|nr:efflux transporter outer membrane subunit [Telmatospirillum siberiense]PKU24806.1 RND transporter [Telmatospirillum siberiense]